MQLMVAGTSCDVGCFLPASWRLGYQKDYAGMRLRGSYLFAPFADASASLALSCFAAVLYRHHPQDVVKGGVLTRKRYVLRRLPRCAKLWPRRQRGPSFCRFVLYCCCGRHRCCCVVIPLFGSGGDGSGCFVLLPLSPGGTKNRDSSYGTCIQLPASFSQEATVQRQHYKRNSPLVMSRYKQLTVVSMSKNFNNERLAGT